MATPPAGGTGAAAGDELASQRPWLQEYGQHVDLTARIREILINYPEGTSVLKELLQNADDAKATTVRFVLDLNSYGTDSLLAPQLAGFQGPALLAFNDGVFTERVRPLVADFESISRIGDSKKRQQTGKTGRFGVGFNAIYHLTDLPCFVSGETLALFDPMARHLPATSAANPGKRVNFAAHDITGQLADQVAPLRLFGCDVRQPFDGTLFRFPLRTQEQADSSSISKQVYTPAAISALFEDLRQEAVLLLLFLKSVVRIEVLQLQPGQREPTLLFDCCVSNAAPEVLRQRALFSEAATAAPEQQVAGIYRLELTSRDTGSGAEVQRAFLISQRRGGAQLLKMAGDLSKQFQVPLVPWGAVAAEITAGGDCSCDGRGFCFLPLPALTGMPVHLNGFFELSSNRRDVWHGADLAGAGRLRAQWNEALLQLVCAPAYLDLLAAAAATLGPGPEFSRLWPSKDAPEPWQGVVKQLFGHLPGKQLLWTAAGGGRWLNSAEALFPDATCLQQHQEHDNGAQASPDSSSLGPLGEALLRLGLPLAVLPPGVLHMMLTHLPELPAVCSPAAARRAVRASSSGGSVLASLDRQRQLSALLAYCLDDLDLAAGPAGGWQQQLQGLQLLPLADGTSLAALHVNAPSSSPVLVVTEQLERLLVGSQKGLLLDVDLIGPAVTSQLTLLASYGTCSLQQLSVQHLAALLLPRLLPADWQHQAAVHWGGSSITWEWLQALWTWLAAHRQDLRLLLSCGWPLLPVLGGQLVPLLPLQQSPVVLPGGDSWPAGLAEVLTALGVHVLDAASFELPLELLSSHSVHTASGLGVAAAMCAALGRHQQNQQQQAPAAAAAEAAAAKLSAADRRLLRTFLLQRNWFGSAAASTPGHQQLVWVAKLLPFYELANPGARAAQLAPAGPAFVALTPASCLAPAGVLPAALSSNYLVAASDEEAAVMTRFLGVHAPSAAQVYRRELLPNLGALPPSVRDEAMLLLLRSLPELQHHDRGLMALLAATPFLPNGQGQLHTPDALYDPRCPELVALLDPEACFPAPAFCGGGSSSSNSDGDGAEPGDNEQQQQDDGQRPSRRSSSSGSGSGGGGSGFSSLAVLQQLGLRSAPHLGTFVEAGRYVECLARDGDEELAAARGMALLAFLNSEAERLVGQHTAITSAAAAVMAQAAGLSRSSSSSSLGGGDVDTGGSSSSKGRPGAGLFRAMKKGLWGLAGKPHHQQQSPQQRQQQQQQDAAPDSSAEAVIAAQWAELARTSWCPVLTQPPEPVLPWQALDSSSSKGKQGPRLAAPCAMRPQSDLWLVSAVAPVVDGQCSSPVLRAGLGWDAPLTGTQLGLQLSALGSMHRHVADGHTAQLLARMVPVLLEALGQLPAAELAAAAAVLEGRPSVWVGNGFVSAARVAFKGGMDLAPHLFVLPLELSPFRDVLAVLGAQEAFSAGQYTRLLQDLADEAGSKPLQPQQLAQALAVVQALADVLGHAAGSTSKEAAAGGSDSGTVLVPDASGVMRPAADLAFDDAPWMDGAGTDEQLQLVHPRISAPVADALGVASRRRLMLASASASYLSLGLVGGGGGIEAFGQSEALTTRLRQILRDYPEGPGVLLELAQNADDAGATRVAFMLDARQHPTGSLLGPAMAALQGPALLAYNDATFSPGDLQAIARIGQDGKMDRPAAIGRFGLGFNATYHLTDVPSFVSAQHLIMFDPHSRFLPGASPAQPGLRLNLAQGRLCRHFPDAFRPYQHFGCTMEGSFPGTLFRFPLRTSATAATSDIKPQPTSPQQALELLLSLQDVLPQALLFLKSLRQVEVWVVGDVAAATVAAAAEGSSRAASPLPGGADDAQPQLLFRAALKPLDGAGSLQQPIMSCVSAGGGGSGVQQLDAFYRRLASTADADLPSSIGRVQLSLSAPRAATAAASGHQLAAGGLEEHEVLSEEWLVCNQLGGGAAKQLALETWKAERLKAIPWVGVAAQLSSSTAASSSNGRSLSCASGTAGRAFCFLPLPAETHLPVHLNGCFELSSNRRNVWHGDDMSGAGRRRAQWNEALLNGAIAQAYAALLQVACQLLGPGRDFWRLLPLGLGAVPQPWLQVAAALYTRIASLPLLYSPVHGGCWLPPRRVLLPDAACYAGPGGDGPDARPQQQQADNTHHQVGYVPDGHQPSFLAQLLVQCGLPLVLGLTQAQQACMLQWSAATTRLDPATARAQLASNAQLVAAAVERHHARPAGAEPAAAVLLRYALSDVGAAGDEVPHSGDGSSSSREQQQEASNSTRLAASRLLQALKQLNGLPLLPLADGRVQALAVGLHTPSTAAARQREQPAVCYVPTSAEERQLLARLQHHTLHDGVQPDVHTLLLRIARARSTNVHEVTSHRLDEHLLPLLLPAAWHSSSGLDEVAWQPPEDSSVTGLDAQPAADEVGATDAGTGAAAGMQQQQQPSRAFIRLLWQWLASRTDAADISHWPILPTRGGTLRLLKQPAQVLRAGEQLPEQLLSALHKLGCRLLDTSVLDGLICPALSAFVQEPTAAGLLDALAAAQALAAAAQAARLSAQHDSSIAGSSVQHSWQQQLQALSGAERHQLRHHLLQAKWFSSTPAADAADAAAGLTAQRLQVLRCLPIFEVHQPLPYEDDSSAGQEEQLAASAAAASTRTYVALAGPSSSREPVLLPPPGISNGQVLGSRFLKCESDSEEAALQQLGVRQLSMREWVVGHLATAPQQLQQRALTATVAHILANMPQLAAADPTLPAALCDLPLIPTRAAVAAAPGSSSGARLAAPSALFDRHSTPAFELLLDPLQHFPAPPFDGSSSGGGGATAAAHAQALLKGLTLCGLRAQLTLEVLVLAACGIAEHAADDATPHARAQQLVRHLDDWARRHPEPSDAEAALWRELQGIAWCPVLLTPPERGLPWPHHIPAEPEQQQQPEQPAAPPAQPTGGDAPAEPPPPLQRQQQQQVMRMPPKMVAPAEMAWLTSAALRLLAAPCPSSALCKLLGWTHQQVLRPAVAVAQLVQMGELYPAGQVTDPALCARLAAAAGQLYASLAASVQDGNEQRELVETTLSGTACVWVGSGFAFAAVSALGTGRDSSQPQPADASSSPSKPNSSGGTGEGMPGAHAGAGADADAFAATLQQEQLLWLVPASLLQQHPAAATTLQAAGVAPAWSYAGYVVALAVVGERAAGEPLSQQQLSVVLRLADAAANALVAAAGSSWQLQQPGVMAAVAHLLVAAADGRPVTAAGGPDVLLLPDAGGVMAPPSDLHFQDATWLEAEGLRLACADLSQATAEALGVRSMRWQHQVGEQLTSSISCPSVDAAVAAAAAVLATGGSTTQPPGAAAADAHNLAGAEVAAPASLLGRPAAEGPLLAVLMSILRWADQRRCAAGTARSGHSSSSSSSGSSSGLQRDVSLTVVLDERQHGTQSLLHPGLAKLQGPAVCVVLQGISALSSSQLAQLFAAASPAGSVTELGLPGVWAVTDVLQAMSGDTTALWDPAGSYLAQTVAELRAPAPRGCTLRHTQPDLAARFADQFAVWDACRTAGQAVWASTASAWGAAAAAAEQGFAGSSPSEAQLPFVGDALYLRLPLRLQDQHLQAGSALASGAAARLGVPSRSLGLDLQDVRRQVAAFGPAAARSLLFLGRIHRVSSAVVPAGSSSGTVVQLWQAAIAAPSSQGSGGMPLRVGAIAEKQLARYMERSHTQGSNLLARFAAAGARAVSGAGRAHTHSDSDSGTALLHTAYELQPLQDMAAGRPVQLLLHQAQHPGASPPSQQQADSPETGIEVDAAARPPPQQQQQQQQPASVLERDAYNFLVCVCSELQPPAPPAPSGGTDALAAALAPPRHREEPSVSLAAVAACTGVTQHSSSTAQQASSGSAQESGILPAAGAFAGAAVPGGAARLLGQQNVLMHMQGPGTAVYAPPSAAIAAAGSGDATGQPALARRASIGSGSSLEPAVRAALNGLVSAWQHMLLLLLEGASQQPGLYLLLPDLVAAVEARDEAAMFAFKQMYVTAANMAMWQLQDGRCVHIQEGAFLPPRGDAAAAAGAPAGGSSAGQSAAAAAPAPAAGLGEEAREFLVQHLPLFKVPWRIVAQLQAASTTGLRIVSPAVLRSLLRSTAHKAEQSRGVLRHPYETLAPSQAKALLEFCCSDLTATDAAPVAASASDAAGSRAAAAPVDEAAAARSSTRPAAPQQPALPPGLEGAAGAVAEVFGAAGLAALGGLANQLQQRVGNMRIDEVIGAVMDAMQSEPAAAGGGAQQRQQQAQPVPARAAASSSSSSGRDVTTAGRAPVDMQRVQTLTGLPVVTAAGTIVVLGRVRLFVFPTGEGCPPPTALLPAQQQRSFMSPELAASLGPWLLKYPEVRQVLKLEFLSLQRLAEHLAHTLAPTWTFAADAGSSGGGPGHQAARLHHQPGLPGFPAVIPWDDGAAGGPLLDWLHQLWQVLLHLIAAAPEWERSMHSSSSSSGGGSGVAAGDATGGYLRSAAQRARGLVDVLAAEVAGALDPAAAAAAAAAHPAVAAAEAGATATAADAQAAEALKLWQPLLDWPLLPLADGRLLKLRHRELVLALLPDYQQQLAAGAGGAASGTAAAAAAASSPDEQAPGPLALAQPWSWLLPALCAAGQPLLDPRFSFILGGAAAGSSSAAATPAPLPEALLFGPLPQLGRPPFLGPLVQKMAAADATLDGLDFGFVAARPLAQLSCGLEAAVEGSWGAQQWRQLFELLAANPPRDLQPDGVAFLRTLPMFALAPPAAPPATQHLQEEQQGADAATDAPAAPQLVALGAANGGGEEAWVLAPAALRQTCQGLLALPSLPRAPSGQLECILEHQPQWGELYHILGLEPASLAALLRRLLLPHLPALSAPDRAAALEFVRRHWAAATPCSQPLKADGAFVEALKAIPFLPAAAATAAAAAVEPDTTSAAAGAAAEALYRPSQLFDPTVPLFAAVMGAVQQQGGFSSGGARVLFPAAPYDSGAWAGILRVLGLQHTITKETFSQLAEHVARQAAALASPAAAADARRLGCVDVSGADAQQLAAVTAAADALLAHLKAQWTGLGNDRPFWQHLATLQFVPAALGVPGTRAPRPVFTSCGNVAQHKDFALVWSVRPLLSDARAPPPVLRQQLGMRSPPPLSVVLQHLQTLGGSDAGEELLASWPDSLPPFDALTLAVLEHLDKEGLSQQQALHLSAARFIPVAHASRLVAPQACFMRLGGAALAPFAWEVPGQFVGKAVLLKQLGVREEPRAEDLVTALTRFAGQLAGRRMNPNELAACLRLLAFLSSRAASPADAAFLASARQSGALLVPTAAGQLMPAGRVVHLGGSSAAAAARLLGRGDPQHLLLAHPQVSGHVCRWLGVPALSESLSEQLDSEASDLTPLDAIGAVQLSQLRALLAAPEFAAAVFSIAAAHVAAVPSLRQLDLGAVSRLCGAASQGGRLRFVVRLATKVVLSAGGRDVTRDAASRQVYEFYELAPDSAAMGVLYVAQPPRGLPLSALLAQVLSRALGCPFTLPLHPLLEVPDAERLSQLQPVLHPGGYDQELEAALSAGNVGCPLTAADRALLRLRPLRHYAAGELVAVKRTPPAAAAALPSGQAAAAAAEARAASQQHQQQQQQDGAAADSLVYGRVAVDAAPAKGQAAYRLSVEVAPGAYETLLSTQVFCFQSGAQGAPPAATSAAHQEPPASPATAAAASSSVVQQEAAAAAAAPTQQASELAAAVADMLNAAGMPLDLDKQQLLQRALAADAQLAQATGAVAELRQEVGRREEELEAARGAWQCRVCFSRDVEQAFIGCGHMYCSACMPSLQRCPVCRKGSQKIRLFR